MRMRAGGTRCNETFSDPLPTVIGRDSCICAKRMDSERSNTPPINVLLEMAANETAEGISISDMSLPDRPLIYLNEGFERLTGYSRTEALGRNCRFLQGPDTNQAEVDKIRHAIKNGEECTVELLNYRKTGEPFWNRLSLSPIKNETGEVTHYVGVQSDITELNNTRQRLILANRDLNAFRALITRELDQARMVQRFLLPATLPSSDRVRFVTKFSPMAQIGGDFYDVVEIGDGNYGILIADVTGHGIPAALLTFMSSITFKITTKELSGPAQVIAEVNRKLYQNMPEDAFLTMFYAEYDSKRRVLTYTQAGHPEALLLKKEQRQIMTLSTDGTLVGVFSPDQVGYTQQSVSLNPGDRLLLYTDALVEVMRDDDVIGLERVMTFLKDNFDAPLEELIAKVYRYGLEFSGREKYDDDFALVGMEAL